jgi:serine/threonine protein kinase
MNRHHEQGPGLLPGFDHDGLWPDEMPEDARAFLERHPQLRADKGAVLDLAYDEYCRLVEAGAAPDPDAFCDRFPTFRSSLRRAIQAHDYLEANPALLEEREPIAWPFEGETFLGFRLLRELGRGAFARVFLAAEPDLGDRLVAVKVSPHGGHEAQTLGRLDHPNVVKVHAVRKDERSGLTAVCMPYLGGATLEGVLAAFAAGRPGRAGVILDAARKAPGPAASAGPPPHPLLEMGTYAEGVCLLGAQLADALAFLHRRDIYHRDLKPSNVLLCPDGRPMLLDFNLSADAQAGRERLGGTLPYMSPEQVLATFGPDPAAAGPVDGRSDLFSLGVILFELLTGRQPFPDAPRGQPSWDDCAALLARQEAGAPPVRRLCPEVSPALAAVIDRCLAFQRVRRPRDAAEVAALLHRDLAPQRRAVRRLLRHPRKLAAAAAVALVLVGAGAAYVATRPSYLERTWAELRAASAAGANATVLDRAGRVLDRAPDSAEAYFLRGRAYQRRGEFALAADDYRQANALTPDDGRALACLAYCCALEPNHRDAIHYCREALAKGFRTAEVYNNLAYSQMNYGQAKDGAANVDEALKLMPQLPAANHNRLVLMQRKLRLAWNTKRLPPGYLGQVDDARRMALAFCPASAELYADLADLCAAAGKLDRTGPWDDRAVAHLEEASKRGLPVAIRRKDAVYQHLQNNPGFVALMTAEAEHVAQTPVGGAAAPTPCLADPLNER